MIAMLIATEGRSSWVVVVTYGTQPFSIYAEVPNVESAMRLLDVARSRGYQDAKVMPRSKFRQQRAQFMTQRTEKCMRLRYEYHVSVFGRAIAEEMQNRTRRVAERYAKENACRGWWSKLEHVQQNLVPRPDHSPRAKCG